MLDDQASEITSLDVLQAVLQMPNMASELAEDTLREIGRDAVDGYRADRDTMADYLSKTDNAIELAEMVREEKTVPFENASNVQYPLVASAALQFNARSYPAICPGENFVRCRTWGNDDDGRKASRADRVSAYMSWQLAVEMEEWEAETDKMLTVLPIVGDAFRKVWFDGERARCRLIDPGKFIVNSKAQTIMDAPRLSEEISLYPYEIAERERSGWFVEGTYDKGDERKQNAEPIDFIEQHTRIDMDGDGYTEPYIVTAHVETGQVVRMVPDFEADDVDFETETKPVEQLTPQGVVVMPTPVPVGVARIKRRSYFVHYQFMPPRNGGLFGTGFGFLLADISAAVNSSINMLIDAGHYASLGGGFIGGEFRISGAAGRFRPGEYKKVPTGGNDIRTAIVERTLPKPDATLFAMLGMLIDAGERLGSISDVLAGDQKQNTTATTTMALIEQGLKVFTACYKRIFRSLGREYAIIARINAQTLDPETYSRFLDERDKSGQPVMHDPAADFGAADMDIQPIADPSSVTKMQEMAKGQLVLELAQSGLGVDPQEAANRILEAANIPDRDRLVPEPDPMMQQMQQEAMMMQRQAAQADLAAKAADLELTIAKVEETRASAMAKMAGAEKDLAGAEKDRVEAELADDRLRIEATDRLLKQLQGQRDAALRAIGAGYGGMARTPGQPGVALPPPNAA